MNILKHDFKTTKYDTGEALKLQGYLDAIEAMTDKIGELARKNENKMIDSLELLDCIRNTNEQLNRIVKFIQKKI